MALPPVIAPDLGSAPLSSWTTDVVADWVAGVGFKHFAQALREGGVDGEQLALFEERDLLDMGLTKERSARLLRALKPLIGGNEAECCWAWGDPSALASLNPARWSSWMKCGACQENLLQHAEGDGGASHPVELCIGRSASRIVRCESVEQAVNHLQSARLGAVPGSAARAAGHGAASEEDGGRPKRADSGMMGDMLQQAGTTLLEIQTDPRNWRTLSAGGWEGLLRSLKFATTAGNLLVRHQFRLRNIGGWHLSSRATGESGGGKGQEKAAAKQADRQRQVEQLNRETADKVLELILDLKGYYIKAAQTLTGAGQLPREAEEAFAVLLDQCPREEFSVVSGIIEEELGCPIKDIFRELDRDAIAAASIGQVHFGTLHDGTRVAVKVQYPQVEKYFDIDLKMVSLAVRLAGMGDKVKEVFKEMQNQFKQEFDYRKEGSVMRSVAENILPRFGDRVAVPLPLDTWHPSCKRLGVKTLCTRKVLVMERLDGRPIREHTEELVRLFAELHGASVEEVKRLMDAKDLAQVDENSKLLKAVMAMGEVTESQSRALGVLVRVRNASARLAGGCMSCACAGKPKPEWVQRQIKAPLNGPRLARLLFDVHGHEMFQDGLFNSDPHAGNVLMLPDGRLGLIDYGAVLELSPAKRSAVARLFIAIADQDDDAVPAAFWECGFKSRKSDPRLALLLANVFFNRGPHPEDMNRLAPKVGMPQNPSLFTLDRYLRGGAIDDIVEFPGHLVLLQRCAMVLSGLAMELGAGRVSSAKMLSPHARKWLEKQPLISL